jgi:NAD(P)-dependent dehydrogenase (short-subunit alcohol dehydrogenase family)
VCAREPGRLQAAIAEFDPQRCLAVPGDVADPDAMELLVAATVERFGRLDGVAALAGSGIHGSAFALSLTEWRVEVMDKIAGVLNVVRAARSHLAASGAARIVTVTAPTARHPDPNMAAVSAARAAIDNLTRALALELARDAIAVNAVAIGLVDTPRQRRRHRDDRADQPYESWLAREAERRQVPMRRAAVPDEVARVIVFALSPMLSYTTGSVFDATGGLSSR